MFCFQCQETAKNTGCTIKGVCGKPEETANLQDLLIFVLKGISVYGEKLKELGVSDRENDDFVVKSLFATITNANWDDARFTAMISDGLKRRDLARERFSGSIPGEKKVNLKNKVRNGLRNRVMEDCGSILFLIFADC